MTGVTVKRLRTRLGLDTFTFASVLGVHVSSIYRWESKATPTIDPLQREILIGLHERKISPEQGADLGKKIREGLIANGTLGGLTVLLNFIAKDSTNG